MIRQLAALALVLPMTFAQPARAAMVSYLLDQSNIDNDVITDGTPYLKVTIDDDVLDRLTFTVTPLLPLASRAVPGFGIQAFGFNVLGANPLLDGPGSQWSLPSGWSANVAPPNNSFDGFGRFEVSVRGTAAGQQLQPLVFQLVSTGLTLASFTEVSAGPAVQGAAYFSALVTGFDDGYEETSAYFGGSVPLSAEVPLPGTLWLLLSGLAAGASLLRRRPAG